MVTLVGSEIAVNSASDSDDQSSPEVAALSGGGFVEAWIDVVDPITPVLDVRVQRFDSSGAKVGGETDLGVTSIGYRIAVAGLASNAFVVSWADDTATEAQLFNSSGNVSGSSFAATNGNEPALATLTGGSFVVVAQASIFTDPPNDTQTAGVAAGQVYDAAGSADLHGPFTMGSVPNSFVFEPSVAALSSGGSVVTWTDGLDDGVFAQKLDAHGSLVDSQLTVTTAQGSAPDVAPLASDGFVVVWDGGFDVVARIYNSSSNPVTNAFVVNDSSTNAQHSASVATLGNGKFVVIWLLDAAANETIKGQVFNADGTRSGSEFTVTTNAAPSSVEVMPPKVTALGSDEFVVTWDNVGTTDGVNNTIHAQIFSSAIVGSPPVANSDTHAVVEYATTSGNVISGTTGGDVADTDSDGDTLTVTAITGANGAGTVGTALAGAKGTLTIHADGSYSYAAEHTQPLAVGATVQDQFTYTVDDGHGNTDSATLTVSITGAATGTPGNDWLLGGATGGTLDGKGGHDTLTGGPAGDSFRFDGALNAANLAHITNFVHGADKIALSGHIFENKVGSHLVPIKVTAHDFYAAAHATKAHAAGDRIIYNKTTGALYFDPDGTGPKHAVEFAVLDTHPALTFHDFMMVA